MKTFAELREKYPLTWEQQMQLLRKAADDAAAGNPWPITKLASLVQIIAANRIEDKDICYFYAILNGIPVPIPEQFLQKYGSYYYQAVCEFYRPQNKTASDALLTDLRHLAQFQTEPITELLKYAAEAAAQEPASEPKPPTPDSAPTQPPAAAGAPPQPPAPPKPPEPPGAAAPAAAEAPTPAEAQPEVQPEAAAAPPKADDDSAPKPDLMTFFQHWITSSEYNPTTRILGLLGIPMALFGVYSMLQGKNSFLGLLLAGLGTYLAYSIISEAYADYKERVQRGEIQLPSKQPVQQQQQQQQQQQWWPATPAERSPPTPMPAHPILQPNIPIFQRNM